LMADEVDDVVLDRRLAGTDDSDRLVQRDVDMLALASGDLADLQRLAIDLDLVALAHFRADPAADAIDGDPAFGDQAVGFATRAEAGLADVFVEAHAQRQPEESGAQAGTSPCA